MKSEITKRVTLLIGDLVSVFTRMKRYNFVGENIACNLCGNHSRDIVWTRDRYGNKLTVVICTNCGLVFLNPMPSDEEVDVFYTKYYRKIYHNKSDPRPKSVFKASRGAKGRFEFLQPILSHRTRLLDVGSGGGEAVYYFRQMGIEAHGVEPNEAFARYSKENYDIPVYISPWQDAEIDYKTYDVVTAHHVVEHLRSPFEALTKFREWLVPGGYLYISVPNVHNPDRTPFGRFHFAHLYYFNRETLIMMALKVGFEVSDKFPGHSTTIVFRRTETPPVDWFRFPGNYVKMARFFKENTNVKYFLSRKPYIRWVRRMNRLGGDILQATFWDGKS